MDLTLQYREKLLKEIEERGLSRDQVFNADETGFFWKALPEKTLASSKESNVHAFKMRKDRVTVMVCANASGTFKLL